MVAVKSECLTLLTFCLYLSSGEEEVIRTLSHGGQVRGFRQTVSVDGNNRDIDTFLGVPYAKPPVGIRRFAAPEAHGGWSGVKNATTRPLTCWQYLPGEFDLQNPAARMWLNNTEMSEDCLYLNIWSPAKHDQKLPVLVWIYGGGFTTGSSTLDIYDGSVLAATQQVIVLSMQYRLGAFGFLRLDPEAGTTSKIRNNVSDVNTIALGNQGLYDQLLALEWTNENIIHFGGNPNQVTIFGESAGAVSVSILWLSPLAQRFFRRAIIHSGSAYARWGLSNTDEANNRSSELAVACGCKPPSISREGSIKCLQSLDPITLINNLDSIAAAIGERRLQTLLRTLNNASDPPDPELLSWAVSSRSYFDVPLPPIVDGFLLPAPPDVMLSQAHFSKLKHAPELLVGVNKNEGMYFLMYGLAIRDSQFLYPNGTVNLPEGVRLAGKRQPLKSLKSLADFHRITAAQLLDEKYLINGITQLPALFYGLPVQTNSTMGYADPETIQMSGEELMQRLDLLSGDADFVCPTLNYAELVAKMDKSKVFLYEFRRRTNSTTMPEWAGVMHGYELEYVFGMPRSERFQDQYYRFNDEERQLSDMMMKMWTNFAKRGDPNLNDNGTSSPVRWPKYRPISTSAKSGEYLILDTEIQSSRKLKIDGCRFWLHQMSELSAIPRETCDDLSNNAGRAWHDSSNVIKIMAAWIALSVYLQRSLCQSLC
ncbi:unnamed protein product [Dicrocoelium dendriticum]|nr:unnamed protein product [Dicrocoelium dendriticum]